MSHTTDLLDQIPTFGRPSRKTEYQNAEGNSMGALQAAILETWG